MKVQWGGGILESKRKNPKDLQRFSKNKKLKTTIIGSIIGIIIIIGGINLYRAFALYKVEKTFNVLNGVVPNFKKVYTEDILHGADPVLDQEGELVPVKINENGNVTKANVKEKWYEYGNKEWANAVILTSTGKSKNYKEGATIDESDIESYFVWIPKYSYKLFDMGTYQTAATKIENKNNKVIEIEFGVTNTKDDESNINHKECATPMLSNKVQGESGGSGNCSVGEWMTHPAFLAFNTNGLWVGKFETGYKDANENTFTDPSNTLNCKSDVNVKDIAKLIIKPNSYSWRCINIANIYQTSYDYERNLESHMMKNTEWGTVAYLTQSIYGRCNGTTCTEVTINGNSSFKTGYSESNISYTDQESVKSSTTGNYSGIYDMNGGACEYMASTMYKSDNINIDFGSSGLSSSTDKRYYDVYNYNNNMTYWDRRILGDATGEMGPFQAKNNYYVTSYFNDWAIFIKSSAPWFRRGSYYKDNIYAGIFASDSIFDKEYVNGSFRIVLAPSNLQ